MSIPAEIPAMHVVILGAVLFSIGIIGVLARRNMLVILMSIELMLNGANVVFVGYSRMLGTMNGHMWALFIMAVAACEVAIGLAILVTLYKDRGTLDISEWNFLREEDAAETPEFPG